VTGRDPQDNLLRKLNLWVPRVLIGMSIVFLLYFTQRTYRFKGLWDDSFLAQDNLDLIRGPWAKKMYYERGLLDYEPKELFSEKDFPKQATPEIEIHERRTDVEGDIKVTKPPAKK